MQLNPCLLKDAYKVGHVHQYPKNTTLIFNNFTPRKSKLDGINHSVFYGLQYFLSEYLGEAFDENFFRYGKGCAEYYHKVGQLFTGFPGYEHINQLYKLDLLPLAIYALPEGTVVPCGVPALVSYNTHRDFFWLPNMLETLMSCTLWSACTSATIAREYRLILDRYAAATSDIPEFVDYQGHDFSMRGMSSVESAIISGMAHLHYFKGSDTIPALLAREYYYDEPLHIASVPATEHSVMSAGGQSNEFATIKRLITEVYPSGIVSIVSDTWDFWKVITEYLPILKNLIMERDGKVVIRPDSGDPVEILCGSGSIITEWNKDQNHAKGLIECLWDIFGGTINSKGYKQLDPHIGAIYGDAITLERCETICERLKDKGFASTNIVFGIGSYSYQYHTRDTLGWAVKATYAEINGQGMSLTKNPKTDDGTKKSHSGLLKVVKEGDTLKCIQNVTWDEFHAPDNELKLVYKDGEILI